MDELESIIGAVRHEQAHRLMRAFHSAPSCLPLASASPFEPPEWLIRAIETGDGIILDEIDVPKYNPPRDIPINSSISGVKGKKR